MKPFVIPASAKSWLDIPADHPFPIQNLPFGLAAPKDRPETLVVAIGDYALDLRTLSDAGLIDENEFPILEGFFNFDRASLSELRRIVFDLLNAETAALRDNKTLRKKALIPIDQANLQVPIPPTAFVDFYSGINHASNVGKMFRPNQPPLLPNYLHVPIGYNGRANTVVVSGTPILRPKGQTKAPDAENPAYGPTQELDFELEMGYFIADGNEHGRRITTTKAEEHILGLVIVNDWSARDVQRWEYQPLGPFLAKSFATSISPWIVTLDALDPFRHDSPEQDPKPLPYLTPPKRAHFDIHLEVTLQTAKMRKPQLICQTNMNQLYWSIFQQLAHQTSNGTPVEFGDLYATGTISGTEPGTFGSMLELCFNKTQPLVLTETGENRTYLEDGDTLTITAFAQGDGYRIGFGSCTGTVLPARD